MGRGGGWFLFWEMCRCFGFTCFVNTCGLNDEKTIGSVFSTLVKHGSSFHSRLGGG